MTRFLRVLALFGVVSLSVVPPARAQDQPASLRVFLDCPHDRSSRCDEEFIRSEITLVDFVRDRDEADVHILVTAQGTGSGGRVYNLNFIGRRRFAALSDTLSFTSNGSDTDDVRRRGMTNVIEMGLVRYLSRTALARSMDVVLVRSDDREGEVTASIENDPWKYWVFSVGANPQYNGEEAFDRIQVEGNVSANRTTEEWKIRLSANGNYQRRQFDVEAGTLTSTTRRGSLFGQVVNSLSSHWSTGGYVYANTSSQSNIDASVSGGPQIEYNVFPYSVSTSREFRINYGPRLAQRTYGETTIFGLEHETVLSHALRARLDIKQRWGSVNFGSELSHLLTNFDRSLTDSYRLEFRGGSNITISGGLSFYFGGSYNLIRDQLFLPLSGASDEDILLGTQSLPTGYDFSVFGGFNYRFGSIFNNVVNPRLDFD